MRDTLQAKDILHKISTAQLQTEKDYYKHQLRLYRIHLARERKKIAVLKGFKRSGVLKTRERLHNIDGILTTSGAVCENVQVCKHIHEH